MKKKKIENRFQITELFASYVGDKWFYGTIKEVEDTKGNSTLFSKITINDGFIIAQNPDRDELSNQLNRLTETVIFGNLEKITHHSILCLKNKDGTINTNTSICLN